MMKIALLCLCVAAIACVALAVPHKDAEEHHGVDGKTYKFGYEVKSKKYNNFYGHRESKDKDGRVSGQYYVLLPDGRTQVVCYTVCRKSGYQATVKYLKKGEHFHFRD